MRPASVSFSTWQQTSLTSFGGRSRSTRWMDDGVIDERHALLAEFVPAPGVVLIRIVKVRVGAEGRQKRCLVVRRTAHPAVGHARPFGDGVAAGDQIRHGLRRLEEGVRHSPIARVRRQQQLVLSLVVMQGVEQARHHPRGVAEGRMGRDVLDAFAIDEDLAAVAQRFDILRAGLRSANFHLADIFRPPRESDAVIAAVGFHLGLLSCRPLSVPLPVLAIVTSPRIRSPGYLHRVVRYANLCAESEPKR